MTFMSQIITTVTVSYFQVMRTFNCNQCRFESSQHQKISRYKETSILRTSEGINVLPPAPCTLITDLLITKPPTASSCWAENLQFSFQHFHFKTELENNISYLLSVVKFDTHSQHQPVSTYRLITFHSNLRKKYWV